MIDEGGGRIEDRRGAATNTAVSKIVYQPRVTHDSLDVSGGVQEGRKERLEGSIARPVWRLATSVIHHQQRSGSSVSATVVSLRNQAVERAEERSVIFDCYAWE